MCCTSSGCSTCPEPTRLRADPRTPARRRHRAFWILGLVTLLALGAVLNLLAFFGFLRLRRDYRARGVLMATVLTALVILYYKIF